jgi:hypothetical protein
MIIFLHMYFCCLIKKYFNTRIRLLNEYNFKLFQLKLILLYLLQT